MAGKTLSEQIYDELYHDITRQQLRCGQKLTLNMLKERFHVSHTPIREALMRLAENGLVTYYSNCGVTVIEFGSCINLPRRWMLWQYSSAAHP